VEGSLGESRYEMTDHYFKKSLTIMDGLQKNRFLNFGKLGWRPLENVIERMKE